MGQIPAEWYLVKNPLNPLINFYPQLKPSQFILSCVLMVAARANRGSSGGWFAFPKKNQLAFGTRTWRTGYCSGSQLGFSMSLTGNLQEVLIPGSHSRPTTAGPSVAGAAKLELLISSPDLQIDAQPALRLHLLSEPGAEGSVSCSVRGQLSLFGPHF